MKAGGARKGGTHQQDRLTTSEKALDIAIVNESLLGE